MSLETFTAIILPKPMGKDEYIPVKRIEADILAVDIDQAERIAKAWCNKQLPFHYVDAIH